MKTNETKAEQIKRVMAAHGYTPFPFDESDGVHTRLEFYDGQSKEDGTLQCMRVTVEDDRTFVNAIEYIAILRNVLLEDLPAFANKEFAIAQAVYKILQATKGADYLHDSSGRVWALSHVPEEALREYGTKVINSFTTREV